MKKVDVLNLEHTSYPSRDRNTATIVCNYLRYQGLNVIEDSVFRGFEMINKTSPKLLFITNGVGASINFELVKYASLKGIKAVTLTSEGNFLRNLIPFYVWGWNTDHVLYEDVNMQWSTRTRQWTVEELPDLSGKIKVSGGTGFDYYKIVPTCDAGSFLEKYKKTRYKKIIGVGCWDFSVAYPSRSSFYPHFSELVQETGINRFRKDRDVFNKTILEAVKNNPDILFLLKEHPGNVSGLDMSGIDGAEKFPNTLILKRESIVDCIAVSDLWLTYESTTVIEAWLLGKQTCLLNPSGIDFSRANVYMGSPNFPDALSLQKAIDSFYKQGELPGFKELQTDRNKVIQDTIQWDDGLNHVRAGNEIIRVLNDPDIKKRRRMNLYLEKRRWKQFLLSRGIPYRKNFISDRVKNFDENDIVKHSEAIYEYQIKYYQKLGLSSAELSNINGI
jgi:hypothetical protein